jgi:hypothetical protein
MLRWYSCACRNSDTGESGKQPAPKGQILPGTSQATRTVLTGTLE